MKKICLLIIFISLFLFFYSCGSKNDDINLKNEKVNTKIILEWFNDLDSYYNKSFVPSNNVPSNVSYIKVSILGSDMSTITETFSISSGQANIPIVPVGSQRTVIVRGFTFDDIEIYRGITYNVEFLSGRVSEIYVRMYLTLQYKIEIEKIDFITFGNYNIVWTYLPISEGYQLQMSNNHYEDDFVIIYDDIYNYKFVENLDIGEYFFRVRGYRNIPVTDYISGNYDNDTTIYSDWSKISSLNIIDGSGGNITIDYWESIYPPGGAPLPTYSIETMKTNIEARLQTIGITYADLGLLDGFPTINSRAEDLEAAADINGYFHNFTGLLWDEDKTSLIIPLPANHSVARQRESIIGNILLDGLLWKGRTIEPALKFAISNGGGLRGDRGPSMVEVGTELISMSHIASWLFWGNQTSIADVSLEKIVDIFEMSYTNLPGQSGSFFHVSGLIIDLDITQPAGNRVQRIWWWNDETEEKERFFDNPNFVGGWSANDTVKMMSSDYVINVQLGLSGSQYDGALEQTEAQSVGEYLTYLEQEGVTELYTGFGYNNNNPFRIMMTRFPGVTIPPNFVGGYAPVDITVYKGHNYNNLYSTIKVEYFTSTPFMSIVCDTPDFFDLISVETIVEDTIGIFYIRPSGIVLDESHVGEYAIQVKVNSATDEPIIRYITFKVFVDI